MTLYDVILLCLALAASAHFISIAMLLIRPHLQPQTLPVQRPPITIIRPACGIENYIEETLASAYAIDYPDFEILFCVADPADPIVPVIERLIAAHPGIPSRLLTGDDRISVNPKLNNIVKGWREARHEWIVMTDSNVLLAPDYLDRLLACWGPGVGLVSSPPVGSRPESMGAELECAFLNTYQARWQLAADAIGNGYAQGKTLFWHRDDLERAGGITALAAATAEDIASTRLVRAAGLNVKLVRRPFPQPLGRRTLKQVWRRQVRWAQLRRNDLPQVFWFEPFSFALIVLLPGAIAAAYGAFPPDLLALLLAAWYGAEAVLAAAFGWHFGLRTVPAWIARDLLLPAVWLSGASNSGYEWQGHRVEIGPGTWTKSDAGSRS
jgi:ceramide glucosyltransferase